MRNRIWRGKIFTIVSRKACHFLGQVIAQVSGPVLGLGMSRDLQQMQRLEVWSLGEQVIDICMIIF